MKLLVYMRDGRTVYYVEGRGKLRSLISRTPGHEEESILAVRGIWNPTTGEYVWTRGIPLRFVAAGSIGVVEEGSPNEAKDPASEEEIVAVRSVGLDTWERVQGVERTGPR